MPAQMTSRERLWAAARLRAVDKVPCSPRLGVALQILYDDAHASLNDLALRAARDPSVDLDPHFNVESGVPYICLRRDDDACGLKGVRIRREVTDDGDCEIIERVFETPDGAMREVLRAPKPGRSEYGRSPNPAYLEHAVKGPADLPKVRHLTPDPADYPVGEAYHRMVERVGEHGMVLATVRCPIDHQAGDLRGVAALMVDYYEDRPFFDALVGVCFDRMMAETRALLEAGVRAIFGGWYFTSLSAGWSPAIFREVFLPMLEAHVELVHSYDAIYDYYDDGKLMGIADMVAGAGVDVLETLTPPPVGDADLAELKRRIGDRVCLKGFGDLLYVIMRGTPEQVDAMVRDAMDAAGPVGFIMGTSDSIREGTPKENIAAYFRAAARYGRAACS